MELPTLHPDPVRKRPGLSSGDGGTETTSAEADLPEQVSWPWLQSLSLPSGVAGVGRELPARTSPSYPSFLHGQGESANLSSIHVRKQAGMVVPVTPVTSVIQVGSS